MPVSPFRLALAAALVWASVGCTGDDDPTTAAESSESSAGATLSTPSLTERDAAVEVSIEQLHGGVKHHRWPALKRAISKPVAGWIRHGYSDLGHRGGSGRKAFERWTGDAAKLARRDGDVTTNAMMGGHLFDVVVSKSRVHLYVFARKGVTGGATARVRIRLKGERQDGSSASYAVAGELYLTRKANKWRVFGYDLSRRKTG